ncbi:longitudinals lacking protein, isoforms N/O/W/X/Y-like [Anopheles ziemanni]|uniref:longitudinals lacking protein, isoforms N/O/W/X/Y-like n=1 Tax=Anopheles coustani TaxID=139045 RepID=UPI0026589C46|nr:longitudinals lacking protein, isoforms N/O/W/X/Y-like [Anopheles coustani]XP_058178344.1 longitudinals lacking protein, isoforms N/O/W/X/Y-like [Anopheles ziemanni]
MLEPKVMIMDDGLARYVCPQCGVKYKKMSALRGHMKECGKGAQCPVCPKIVTQKQLWSDYYNFGSLTDDLYGRSDPGRQLSQQARLIAARKNGQNFPCLKCGKWYSTRSIMLRHMNHECGVEKKIQCKFCYKKFRRKWNLEQHIKRLHMSERSMS